MTFFVSVRRSVAVALSVWLSAGLGWTEENDYMRAAVESIRAAELESHVLFLADDSLEGRASGSRGAHAASEYLSQQLEDRGLTPAGDSERSTYLQKFGRGYRNVLGLWEGSDPMLKNEVVLVGAHYDHVGYGSRRTSRGGIGNVHNGADDNASGASAVLEVADAVIRLSERPRRSILFVLWDGEEQGLLGSRHWITNPTVPLHDMAFAINLDMVGRLRDNRLHVIGTRSTLGLRQLVSRQNADLGLHLDFPWKVKARSDHSTFYDRGIPVLMFHTGLHDDYHTPRDDPELLNPEGMQKVTRLLFQVVWALSDRTQRPAFRITSRRETNDTQRKLERPLPPPPPRLGIWWDDSDEERHRPGLLLTKIVAGAPAERAGLKVGDRIIRFDGRDVLGEAEFRSNIVVAENPVTAEVERKNEAQPIELTVSLDGRPVRVGIAWREDPAEPKAVFAVQVILGSPADRAGLKVGDRIYEIAGLTFADSNQFLELVNTLPGPLEMLVERNGRILTIKVEVAKPRGMARVDRGLKRAA